MTVDLQSLAREHGGEYRNGAAYIPTPGHSKRDRGAVIRERRDGDGFVVHAFNADWREVKRALGLDQHVDRPQLTKAERRAYAQQKAREEAERVRAQQERAAALWRFGRPLRLNDPAGLYLTQTRAVPADIVLEAVDAGALRYAEVWGRPALLTAAVDAAGAVRAVQITRVKRDGSGKADIPQPRLTFGTLKDAAVRLAPADATLAIAEGVETALSFRALFGIPTWAALGAAQLQAFSPPPGITRLVAAADSDPAGQKAAQAVLERLRRTVRVQIAPAPVGKDWNDIVRESA